MAESFFSTLACELLSRGPLRSQAEARMACFSYIEGFYNPTRLHSGLGYRSPIDYEKDYLNAQTLTNIPQAGQALNRPSIRAIQIHADASKLREMVRGMIERITIGRHDSGAIEVDVRGAFAGVMQASGLVERYALRTTKAPDAFASGASLSVVAGTGFEPVTFRL